MSWPSFGNLEERTKDLDEFSRLLQITIKNARRAEEL